MAADQQSQIFSCVPHEKISPSSAPKSARNEISSTVLPQAATPNAKAFSFISASDVASTSLQPTSLCRMQPGKGERAQNSVLCGPAIGTELYPSTQILCTSDGSDVSNSTQQIQYDGCCSSSKRTENYTGVPLQTPVIAMDNEVGSEATQCREFSPTKGPEPASKKLRVARTDQESSQQLGNYPEEPAAGEVDRGVEEEEGCTTPTARDQRIPQYGAEVSPLVCPPAPKKKACVSKRRRLLYSADAMSRGAAGRTADNFNSHATAERQAFLVDAPDLKNFPDCIRALFK